MTTHAASASVAPSKALNVGLWVAQILVAAMFAMAGSMKAFTPAADLATKMPALADSIGLVRFIGYSELAGALGLILPAVARITPKLVPAAACGLAVVMVLAIAFHLQRGEASHIPIPIALLALSVFVAWGRFKAAPIAPRG